MRITSKPVLLGVPMLMVAAMVAVLALWALGFIGSGGGVFGGTSSTGTIVWNVEYWHRNADGVVLQYKKDHNTITTNGLDAAVERLIDAETGGELETIVDGTSNEEDFAFDNIVLLKNQTEDPDATAVLGTSILIDVDGTNNADTAEFNPADGLYDTAGRDADDGDGVVSATFLAGSGNPDAALRMLLTKAALNDTDAAAPVAPGDNIAVNDILAFININVDLAPTDTLTVTWTIDIGP